MPPVILGTHQYLMSFSISRLLIGTSHGAQHWRNEMAARLIDPTSVACCSYSATKHGSLPAPETYAMANIAKYHYTANMVAMYGRDTDNAGGLQTSHRAPSVRLKAEGFHVVQRSPPALPLIQPPFSCSV